MKKRHRNRAEREPQLAQAELKVGVDGSSVVVVVLSELGGSLEVPMTAIEARLVASTLMQCAREVDPHGENALIEKMKVDIGERILFESMQPRGPAH